jgi:putative nucleotidyltransferase with HDIG domain
MTNSTNPTSSSNPERILVVDSDESLCQIVSAILENAGYQCQVVHSGAEALAALQSPEPFHLVLTELMVPGIMVPGIDGIELMQHVQRDHPDLPFVFVTAVHDISVALAAIRNGAYDYLLKPFEREQLLAIVRRALENRRLKLETRAYQTNLESLVGARTEELRQAMSDLERSDDIVLEFAGDALDLNDAETEGHSKRVTAFTIAIARAIGLQQDAIRVIARGAFLHDIGKMAIPDAILRKRGALTPEETEIMKEHCYKGYQMLRRVPSLQKAAEIVHSHHERWDGTGYPRGLKGEQIPLGARIVAVAETLDAITLGHPYRAAQTIQAAQEEIKRWAGRQFDPKIVEVFLAMPESTWRDLRREIDSQIYRFSYAPKSTKGGGA